MTYMVQSHTDNFGAGYVSRSDFSIALCASCPFHTCAANVVQLDGLLLRRSREESEVTLIPWCSRA